MGKYFGTDGIRGVVGETLDAPLAFRAGCAAATVLAERGRPRVLIGRDTRISGYMLESALVAGLCSAGADVTLLGVLPTPAVAFLTVSAGADMGVVISASHNPFEHNGIKLFGADGFKLPDEHEERIEYLIDNGAQTERKTRAGLGRASRDGGGCADKYIEYLASVSTTGFKGRIAVDCANGAASRTVRPLLKKLGANFEIICDKPDGVNINDKCGSTDMTRLCDTVRSGGFDVGLAFDGDADRFLAVDETGGIIDGDHILAVCALAMKASGKLKGGAVVGTSMTNSGMEEYMRKRGVGFYRADVGDRNVLRMMLEKGCCLGGETSGHTIFLDEATTGDGQLTAVRLLSVLAESGRPLSELVEDIPRYPQVMMNHEITGGNKEKDAIMGDEHVAKEIKQIEKSLSGEGRIVVRPSGTEALIRVLVEAKSAETAREKAESLINLMKSL